MDTGTSFHSIEKLTEENYESWNLQIKSVLVCNELWKYVTGTEVKTESNAIAWTMKDDKALALIVLNISRGQLNLIKKAGTSKEAWEMSLSVFLSRKDLLEKRHYINNYIA